VQGVLYAANRYEHEFSERQYRTLEVFSEVAAAALSIAGLITRLERQNRALLDFGEERDRLAGKLHESVLQIFYSIGLHAATISPGDNGTSLSEICRLTNYGMREVRFLMSESEIYEQLEPGLEEATKNLVNSILPASNISPGIAINSGTYSIPINVQKLVFQATREFLMNIIKHAQASEVTVRLDINDHEICLSVTDNGKGRSSQILSQCEEGSEHFGLRHFQKSAKLSGGALRIADNAGDVITVNMTVPYAQSHSSTENSAGKIQI
jgi:signal transduction histidine kinase